MGRNILFPRMVGEGSAFFASDWLERLCSDWLFNLAVKSLQIYTYTHTTPIPILNLPNITHSKPNQIKDNALQDKTQKVIGLPTIMGKKPTIMDSLPSWGGKNAYSVTQKVSKK